MNIIDTKIFQGTVFLIALLLAGCGSGGGGTTTADSTPPTTTAAPSVSGTSDTATTLSVTIDEDGTGYCLILPAADPVPTIAAVNAGTAFAMTANVAASQSIGGLTQGTAYKIYFIAKDASNNMQAEMQSVPVSTTVPAPELYVVNHGGASVVVFDPSLKGDVTPLRQFGSDTELSSPYTIAVNKKANQIFVTNFGNNSIAVYGMTGSGNIKLTRTIIGPNTQLNRPVGIAVDTVNNEIFVTNRDNKLITVYASTADGNVAPKRTILSSDDFGTPTGIAVDTKHGEILVTYNNNVIAAFGRTADGTVQSPRVISGNITGLENPSCLAVDIVNDQIYVTNLVGDSITVYGRSDTGNIAPKRTIRSQLITVLSQPFGIAVDPANNQLFVGSMGTNKILVYHMTDDGYAAPIRTISGANTGLNAPVGIALQ